MTCTAPFPVVFDRDGAAIRDALAANRRGYVPEWVASNDAGMALIAALARNVEIQSEGLNAAPLRLQLSFLESIGANVLPAQAARAPLVFALLDTASSDAAVPAGCRVGAVLPPPAPSLDGSTASPAPTPPEFYTEQAITAMRGSLAALYSIDPQSDTYADHSAGTPGDFIVFGTTEPVPHRIYLGHEALFNLAGSAEIVLALSFGAASGPQRPLLLDWEYLSVDGWLPLALVADDTARFTHDGTITLAKGCGPDSKNDLVAGIASCWIRASVSARTPSARVLRAAADADAQGLYAVDVESSIELLPGDVVTVDGSNRSTVHNIFGASLRLDAPLAAAQPGDFLTLADALPPLRPEGADLAGALPELDVVRARVGFEQTDLTIDSAKLDGFALDISKDFYPFGEQPRAFAAFYLACKSAFSRTGARIELTFTFSKLYPEYTDGTVQPPRMQGEYFSGGRWLALGSDHEYVDGTVALTRAAPDSSTGTISFVGPEGWEEAEIGGERELWLRLRLVDGDYGQPLTVTVEADPDDSAKYVVKSAPSTLKPPLIARVAASYTYFTNPTVLEQCVCENDFAFVDRSEDARWPRRPFAPFTPVSDRTPALHFGFSTQPPAALVSLLVQVLEAAAEGDPQPFAWDYWGSGRWNELSVRDTTGGLRRTGLVQFVGAPDAQPRESLGGTLYRIRARLKEGLASGQQAFHCGGVWLNAVWASHGRRAEREPLGVSDGNPDQTFALSPLRGAAAAASPSPPPVTDAGDFEHSLDVPLAGVPVQIGEAVEVREWTGRGDDWRSAVADVAPENLRFERDPKDPTMITAAWVRWCARPDFYRSGPKDRDYVLERATGVFRFPSVDGFIPPAGCPIVVSYVTGGGIEGNVPANAIRELRSNVGFVKAVGNALPATGGAAAELLRATRDRNAQVMRHRGRAVAFEDYEWLARSASPEVARARALPLAGPDGRGSRGFVAVVVVPHSRETMPVLSMQLADTVLRYLTSRAPAGIGGGLRVLPPSYLAVGVRADVAPASVDEAATVEARMRTSLTSFLHPTTGGIDGRGWDFGDRVYLSDVAALIRRVAGVATIEQLQLMVGQVVYGDSVPVAPEQLVCAGEMKLRIVVASSTYALA
jgi:hypothetical protein